MADEDDGIFGRLPDDVLVLIIARLPSTRDAHRTSVLSKRWTDLHKLVPHVSLSCSDFLSPAAYSHYPHKCCWRTYFAFLYGRFTSDRYLKMLYKGQHKIRSLQLRCCISKHEESSFDTYFFYYLQHSDLESLDLCFSCRDDCSGLCFSLYHLHQLRSLKLLRLSLCLLKPLYLHGNGKEGSYSHLQTLEFTSVKVLPDSVETILSTCLGIHSLSILECDCSPAKIISIPAAAANLNSLKIRHCRGVEKIHVSATNLALLEFVNSCVMGVDLVLVRLPHLQTLHYYSVQGLRENSMPRVFGKFVKKLPNLRSLNLASMSDFFTLEKNSILMSKAVIGVFVQLRKLELHACSTLNVNLLLLIPILQLCPILEEFHLDLQNLYYVNGPQPMKWSENYDYLKKAEMSGFNGEENEIEFALHILRSAPVLEQMRVTWHPKCYHRCCGGWETMAREEGKWNKEAIQQKFQGQALSKNAQLVIVD